MTENDGEVVETETWNQNSFRFKCIFYNRSSLLEKNIDTFVSETESGDGVEVTESAAFVQEKETAFSWKHKSRTMNCLFCWHYRATLRLVISVGFSDLGDTSLCRRLGEGVRLRLLLTSPFLALGPDVGLLGPSSSEEDDPESKTKETILKYEQMFWA